MRQLTLWDEKPRQQKKEKSPFFYPPSRPKWGNKGTKVAAAEIITFADGTHIEQGHKGVIKSCGDLTCSVHFQGNPQNHFVMCFWDMVEPR